MPKGNKQGWKNSPYSQQPTTNHMSTLMITEMLDWPAIDPSDARQLRQRFLDYVDLCDRLGSKLLVSGLCTALGFTRDELVRWGNGKSTRLDMVLSSESASELKNILKFLEISWESAMQNDGYRNPVTGIFLGKNNFGYRDESQTVIKHEDAATGPSRKELQAKYMAALPEENEPKPALDVHVTNVEDTSKPDAIE